MATLRELREARGLSQPKLAAMAKMSLSSVYNIEHGLQAPTTETKHHLAKALGVKVRDIEFTQTAPAIVEVVEESAPRELENIPLAAVIEAIEDTPVDDAAEIPQDVPIYEPSFTDDEDDQLPEEQDLSLELDKDFDLDKMAKHSLDRLDKFRDVALESLIWLNTHTPNWREEIRLLEAGE